MRLPLRTLLVTAALGLVATPAFAAVVWNESIDPDLSGTFSSPTVLTFSPGTNSILFSKLAVSDVDYFTFTLTSGQSLTSVTLVSYSSSDGTAFLGMQQGTAFTKDSVTAGAADLYGYTHIGTVPGNVGTDILDNMGLGVGAQGFTPPLPAGSYTFWTQQLSPVTTSYQLDFQVIPEPATGALIVGAVALGVIGFRRRSGPDSRRAG